jgi:hypothetical protein
MGKDPTVTGAPPKRRGIILFIVVSVIAALVWLLTSRNIGRFLPGSTPPPSSDAPADTIPTPPPPPSALATESAYLELSGSVASLSSALRGALINDPTLNPPAIELPLGFTLK